MATYGGDKLSKHNSGSMIWKTTTINSNCIETLASQQTEREREGM